MEACDVGNLKLTNNPPVKVHAKICSQLTKLLDKIASILPALESARPGGSEGLKTLCSINCSIGQGKLVILRCSEYSMLYLALTGERILARCEKLRSSVIQNLSRIQSMVPLVLADQVAEVINYLDNVKFAIDSREAEAGKAITQLLQEIDCTDELKSKTLQKVASSLNLTSQTTLLIEKRSIRKQLDQVPDRNSEKWHILIILHDLLKTHAKNIKPVIIEVEQILSNQLDESHVDTCEALEPDDVSYRQVQSLKNVCIPILEGKDENNENPVTKAFKETNEAFFQVAFPWSVDYVKTGSFSGFGAGNFLKFFNDLVGLETTKRSKAVEDIVVLLERDVDTCYLMLSNGFGEALIEFLRMSCQLPNTVAQEVGSQLFLAYLRNNRVEFPTFTEEILRSVIPFLDAETIEALVVLQKFSQYLTSGPYSSSKKLSSDDINILEICMEVVCDLSSQDDTKSEIFSSAYLKVLASILSYEKLTTCSLKVLQIFSFSEEGAQLIGRNPKFISCLAELLESSTFDEKEVAVSILYYICFLRRENCLVVRDQFVVPPLVDLSINGSEVAREMSRKLLQILRDLRDDDNEQGKNTGTVGQCTDKQIVSKTSPMMTKKKGVFFRFRSLAHF